MLLVALLCAVSCKKEFVNADERDMARTIAYVTGRDMMKDQWVSRSYAMQPTVLDVSSGSAIPAGFSIDLIVANDFQIAALENRRISGLYHGLRIHIFEHELSRGQLLSRFERHSDGVADVSLAEIYGMTLDVVRNSNTTAERERNFFLYAIKSMLLPEVAKNSVQRVETEYVEAFIFGDVLSDRVVADAECKVSGLLITMTFHIADDAEQNGMALIFDFISALRMALSEGLSGSEYQE